MRFLFANRHRADVVGGSEIQCDLLARRLTELGHAVTYAVMQPGREAYDEPYPCVPVQEPAQKTFGRVLREVRPEVVYWRFNKHGLLGAARRARRSGATFVFAFSHDDDGRPWPPLQLEARAGGASWRRLGGAWKRQLGNALGWLGHAWVDGHVLQHADQAVRVFRRPTRRIRSSVMTETVPFDHPRPFVAWVANLKPRKRPEAFLELARALAGEGVDFLAVGALQHERYREWASGVGFPPGLRYLGPRTPAEANGVVAAARFVVLTCEPEGFPNVLMQAWRQGRPTLTLAYDPEGLIREHRLGAVARDTGELERLAREWIRTPPDFPHLQDFARANFSVETNAAALLAFCRELRGPVSAAGGAGP
jgi:glycosyltransferase involved in cell wall biosynthesis